MIKSSRDLSAFFYQFNASYSDLLYLMSYSVGKLKANNNNLCITTVAKTIHTDSILQQVDYDIRSKLKYLLVTTLSKGAHKSINSHISKSIKKYILQTIAHITDTR